MSVNIVNKSTGALTKIAGNPVEQASGISYDHTSSGMSANNVQAAVDELKSGLTNYKNQNNLNLEVSDRKNILPCKLSEIKASNTNGTWADNVFTNNGVSFTINATDDIVTSIVVNGTSTGANTNLFISKKITGLKNGDLLNGCPANGGNNKHKLLMELTESPWTLIAGANNDADDAIRNYSGGDVSLYIKIYDGYTADNLVFYPMVRPSWYTDNTFAPFIPSVESRIEAVESGLVKITKESFEQITVNAGSKKFVTNVGLLTDNVVVTAYSDNSDVIAYVATATTTYQVYLYNPTNAAITSSITVMVAQV